MEKTHLEGLLLIKPNVHEDKRGYFYENYRDELFEENGMKYKRFYGMSSDTAMERHYGEIESYRASEGKTVTVPYKGEVENTLRHILGGLRSAATYVGARTIKEIPKCTTFVLKNPK